jgi:transcription elongation factor GreB
MRPPESTPPAGQAPQRCHASIMSKAFTKEDPSSGLDAGFVRPRAPLPPDVPNYVTPRGLALLERELRLLEGERDAEMQAGVKDETQQAHLAALNARITDLLGRIHGVVLVDGPQMQMRDEVRFGAEVTVRDGAGRQRRYQIVGIDEANGAEGRLAFVAPVARALLGRQVGEIATVQTPRGEEELEVVAISYGDTGS